jgi:hypothetical protein
MIRVANIKGISKNRDFLIDDDSEAIIVSP